MIAELKSLLAPVPEWVLSGWYANNPERQRFAIARYRTPVATAEEIAAARAYVRESSMPCTSCGRFAFAKPTTCF